MILHHPSYFMLRLNLSNRMQWSQSNNANCCLVGIIKDLLAIFGVIWEFLAEVCKKLVPGYLNLLHSSIFVFRAQSQDFVLTNLPNKIKKKLHLWCIYISKNRSENYGSGFPYAFIYKNGPPSQINGAAASHMELYRNCILHVILVYVFA